MDTETNFEKKEWKHFIEMHISTPRLVSCGSQYASQISSGLGNKFWKEVFKIWADFKYIYWSKVLTERFLNLCTTPT